MNEFPPQSDKHSPQNGRLTPEVIQRLSTLSTEEIANAINPHELHNALVIAKQQIEDDIINLGVRYDVLRDPKKPILIERTSQMQAIDISLQHFQKPN